MPDIPPSPSSADANAACPAGRGAPFHRRRWVRSASGIALVACGAGGVAAHAEGGATNPTVTASPLPEGDEAPIAAEAPPARASVEAPAHATTQPPPAASSSFLAAREGRCAAQPSIGEVELAEALYQGYLGYFGHAPTANRLGCAWAHCAFEHARGTKLFGNNLGHITTAGAWSGATCTQSFTRRVGTAPDRWETSSLTFRVHPTLLDGALDYWRLIHLQYPGVLAHCDRGDAVEAARELRRKNYFTGPVEPYVRSVSRLYLEGLGRVLPNLEHPVWPLAGSRRPGRSDERR